MNSQIKHLAEILKTGYWFVPSLMALGAGLLAFGSLSLDAHVGSKWGAGWFYSGGAEGAREVLSVASGSMITVVGVTFSITIVALSLASQQLGPRLLRNFLRDRGTQLVLGAFVATFLYCLVVLRSVHGGQDSFFLPSISVTIGVLLAIISMGVLIYFVHHVSVLIQAPNLIAAVSQDLLEAISELYPDQIGDGRSEQEARETDIPSISDDQSCLVFASENGYLQAIKHEQLIRLATHHDLIVRLETRPGSFIVKGSAIARVWPSNKITDSLSHALREAFTTGTQQTLEQDAEFAVNQLVEVAVRSLSPGINDPFTAMTAIDWLGAALLQLAQRHIPSACRYDENHRLRVIARPLTFARIAKTAFDQIRQYGSTSVAVTIRLLEMIATVAPCIRREEDRQALLSQAMMIERTSHQAISEELDRRDILRHYDAAVRALTSIKRDGQAR